MNTPLTLLIDSHPSIIAVPDRIERLSWLPLWPTSATSRRLLDGFAFAEAEGENQAGQRQQELL